MLEDLNSQDIAWPDRLNKSGSVTSQSEGQILIDVMSDNRLQQMMQFPTRKKNTLDLNLTSLPGQFHEIHSRDEVSDPDVILGALKIHIPQKRNRRRGGKCFCTKREIFTQ